MTVKLGSLFDGSGGFPLAGALCGIEPVWASEVEPYPIAVTRSRFPNMRHLGDISKVHGGEIEPVDIITFGSPCQDLSVAGKRAGLKHEANGDEETTRSGLFMEAVRIIKEMRAATNGMYPTFALWENVPGAFSSNNGEDFRIVCEELIKIVEPGAVMPAVPEKGWAYADSYVGDGWSLAYRVFDAQYWGVPQRRRRIHLVVDLRGECAREILFEREGLRGYFAQSGETRQGTPADAESSSGADDREGEGNGDNRGRGLDAVTFEPGIARREGGHVYEGISGTLRANAGDNQVAVAYIDKPVPLVDSVGGQAERGWEGTIDPTLRAGVTPAVIIGFLRQLSGVEAQEEVSPTLMAAAGMSGNNKPCVAHSFDSLASNSMKSANPNSGCRQVEVSKTLDTSHPDPSKNQGGIAIVQRVYESHPMDSRIKELDDVDPTVSVKWHKGSADTPLVCTKEENLVEVYDARGNGDGKTVSTITGDHENRITDYSSVICMATQQGGAEIRTDDKAPTLTAAAGMSGNNQPVICLQGNGIDRADTAGCNGKGWKEDTCYTLNTIDRPAVAYAMQGFGDYKESDIASGLKARDYKDATDLVCGVDCRNATEYPELNGTIQAKSGGGTSLNYNQVVRIQYIVRRLTPTECARLQGFADWWGHIEPKEAFTDEEYRFWLEVRNTHAAINGKKVQEYTKPQMLTWYNKLHTDSAEYKMWGNGIALPPALYVMQGIADALYHALVRANLLEHCTEE